MRPSFVHVGKLLGKNEYGDLERRTRPASHYFPANSYKRDIEQEIGWDIIRYRVPRFAGEVMLRFRWHEPPAANGRRRDQDNIVAAQKFILDAMVRQRVIHDDSLDYVRDVRHEVVPEPAGEEYGVEVWVVGKEDA